MKKKTKIFDETAEDRLLDAIDANDSEDLIAMHNEGYLIAAHKFEGSSVLRFTLALSPTLSTIQTLVINLGCSINEKDGIGQEPLFGAVSNVNIAPEIIAFLIQSGANPNARGPGTGGTPIGLAMNTQYTNGNDNIFFALGGEALVNRMREHREWEARQASGPEAEAAYFNSAKAVAITQTLGKINAGGKIAGGKPGSLCIDATMDPAYLRIQTQAFNSFSKQLSIAADEFSISQQELVKFEAAGYAASEIKLDGVALSAQYALRLEPSIRYFFSIGGIELPKLNLSSEAKSALDLTLGLIKISADTALMPGQLLQSSSYYAGMKIYEMLGTSPTTQPLHDLYSFTKNCGGYVATGSVIGLGMGSPLYGAINGAATCLDKHQQLGLAHHELPEQADFRLSADIAVAITTISNGPIAMISAVVAADITVKVASSAYELGLNGLISYFYAEETTEV